MKKKTKFTCDHKHIIAFILGVVLIIFFLALTASTIVGIQNKIKEGRYLGQDIVNKNSIVVSGKGEVYAKPNLALAVFSVRNEAKTVAEAMSENAKKMNAVIDSMKSRGVEDKDLKTTNFNIFPRYEWHNTETGIYPRSEGTRVLVGYEITQSLQVKIRDLGKAGDIIQGAADAGANQVGGLQFTFDNEDELKKQARKEAIREAKEKAKELSSQLGVNLVRIINFSESNISPRTPYNYGLLKEGAGSAETPLPQIETGENKIEVNVNLTFEIN